MGCDVSGLVASNFVLGVVFRGVMNVTLVVEVPGMDGDDCSRYATRLGIPAHVIADFEPSHLTDTLFHLEALALTPPRHCAPHHGLRRRA